MSAQLSDGGEQRVDAVGGLRRDLPIAGLDKGGDLLEQRDERLLKSGEGRGAIALVRVQRLDRRSGPRIERLLSLEPRQQPCAHDAQTAAAPAGGNRRE